MGVGGIIGGGIFAVLGVAAKISGNAAFITYLLAGAIALASGYSYFRMTKEVHEEGGSFTFLEHYVSNNNIAGTVGWILLIGYIGTMAMYSYAFGSFAAEILGFHARSIARVLLSISVIAVFTVVNLLGADETGSSEDLLVYVKLSILMAFGIAGAGTLTSSSTGFFPGGVFNSGFVPAIVGIGAIFVSFEGFQLLTYEYHKMENGLETLKKSLLGSVAVSMLVYILIAAVTTSLLTPEQILAHKETVLAFAASKIFSSELANYTAGFLVSVAALFSTASAINATMFGTARFSRKMSTDGELPKLFSFRNRKNVPSHALITVGVLTALFTFVGTLEEITTFASISFITVFGIVNLLAFTEKENRLEGLISGLGVSGTAVSLLLLIRHLYIDKPHVLSFSALLFLGVLVTEFLYFEREEIEKEVEAEIEDIESS